MPAHETGIDLAIDHGPSAADAVLLKKLPYHALLRQSALTGCGRGTPNARLTVISGSLARLSAASRRTVPRDDRHGAGVMRRTAMTMMPGNPTFRSGPVCHHRTRA
jgi:hypothetical protein